MDVDQLGDGNYFRGFQDGAGSDIITMHDGKSNNTAKVYQEDNGDNLADIYQEGDGNTVSDPLGWNEMAAQNGDMNTLTVDQVGNGNTVVHSQNGDFNTSTIAQTGNNNMTTVDQAQIVVI